MLKSQLVSAVYLKIVHMDLKHGVVKLSLETLDDLWVLYNIIERDDTVYANTTREVKIEEAGRPSSRRMPVFLGLKVEKVYFDRSVNRLRVHGVVTESPEELGIKGAHHTFNLTLRDHATIVKKHWLEHQIESIKRAVVEKEPIIIVALDSEECCIGILRTYGVDVKAEIRSKLPGKLECEKREKALKKYFGDVLKFLTAIHKDADGKIVVVGPSFTKDGFLKFVKDQAPDVASSVVAVKSVSTGGVAGVHESLRSGIISKVLKDARAAEETMLVEEVLSRLGASRKDVSFGLTEVEEDAVAGAVDTLLVCDKSLREATENERNRLDEIMRIVEERGGKIMIISSEHEGGRKLISLGGVASLLRYPKR